MPTRSSRSSRPVLILQSDPSQSTAKILTLNPIWNALRIAAPRG